MMAETLRNNSRRGWGRVLPIWTSPSKRADACTLLVADGSDERAVMDAVRTGVPAADLLVVPRMHHFHTQTGMADHIGSIPVMRIRNPPPPPPPGPARLIKRMFDVTFAQAR